MTSVIVASFLIVAAIYAMTIRFLVVSSRDERRELEDRLMALTSPEGLLLHKANRDPAGASISYVDDESRDDGTGS